MPGVVRRALFPPTVAADSFAQRFCPMAIPDGFLQLLGRVPDRVMKRPKGRCLHDEGRLSGH